MPAERTLPESVKLEICKTCDAALAIDAAMVDYRDQLDAALDLDKRAEIVGLIAATPLAIASCLRHMTLDQTVPPWAHRLVDHIYKLDPDEVTR